MHIAITGGSGRIGHAVTAQALAHGHHVVSIDRVATAPDAAQPNLTFVQTSMDEYDAFLAALRGCDALVHLAAIPSPGRHPDHEVHNNNVVGSYNALRAAAELDITRVCQASSVNATGATYSRWPRYDYFPLDEQHPTYNEDPYSLSKWICEQQADSFVRRYETIRIASLRFHWVVPDRATATQRANHSDETLAKQLWGYTLLDASARACLLALTADFSGHEPFYIVAADTMMQQPSRELAQQFFPDVPVRGDFGGNHSFYDCSKAERMLGWRHDSANA